MLDFPAVLFFFGVLFFFIFRVLNLAERSAPPELLFSANSFTKAVIRACPIFKESYTPPLLWGKSGHIQTLLEGKMGRVQPPSLSCERRCIVVDDGSTVTYDVFEPEGYTSQDSLDTILVVPGIANNSESLYVRTFVGVCLKQVFRVVVLNHLGSVAPLTTPRIFTYGGTEDLAEVVTDVLDGYNCHNLIGVGFSMGANILMKYLGEHPERQESFTCAVSLCQGYDIEGSSPLLMNWQGMRRFYNWVIALNVKLLIGRNNDVLFGKDSLTDLAGVKEAEVQGATSVQELDEAFSRRVAGFDCVREYYRQSSCCHHMHKIKIPVLLLNSKDDPLVPEQLLATAQKHVVDNPLSILALPKYGGHLGFFEGGLFFINPLTWLDKAVIQYILAVLAVGTDVLCTSDHGSNFKPRARRKIKSS